MVERRVDMSQPRQRLAQGENPTAKINRLYQKQQLDSGAGIAGRDGAIPSGAGFGDKGPDYQKINRGDPDDQHAPGYSNDVAASDWKRGGGKGGEAYPAFDLTPRNKPASGNRASGRDCQKSPFSAARKAYNGS